MIHDMSSTCVSGEGLRLDSWAWQKQTGNKKQPGGGF